MAFQNDESDLSGIDWQTGWDWIQKGAQFITRTGGQAQNVGNQVSNAGNNLANLTTWRLDGKTVVVGALLIGAVIYATRPRR